MGLKSWFKASLQSYIQDFFKGEKIEGDRSTIMWGNLDRETAMKYSAVFSCVRVLAETFASCPAMLYRKVKDGREASTDLAIYDILHNKPNDEMAPFGYKETCMMHMNTGGNSASVKLVNNSGHMVGLFPLDWQKIRPERENNEQVFYYRDKTKETRYTRKEIFHIPGMSFDGIIGLSPLEYMASAIMLGLSYEQFGIGFFRNGANSSGAFKHPKALDQGSYDRLKADLKKNYAGLKNAGTFMLLEDGLEFTPFTIKPIEAELLGNKKFQIEDVARCYRVPLHLIQNLDKATNNNIEHQSLEFIMYTMLPWYKRWEENINAQLLTPAERRAGYFMEFKIDGLLRGDAKSRAEAYAAGRQWGWLSVNDIRKLENMGPIPNGDRYLEPLNFIEAGKAIPQEQTAQAMVENIYRMISERSG